MTRAIFVMAALLAAIPLAGSAFAAAYIKYDGVKGESTKAADHRPTEQVAFYYNKIAYNELNARIGWPLSIKDEQGQTRTLQRDGVYSTSSGDKIWVENGRVVKTTPMTPPRNPAAVAPSPPKTGGVKVATGDVTGDGQAAPIDALQVINRANTEPTAPGTPLPRAVDSGAPNPQPAGLLLPAVQSYRANDPQPAPKKKGNIDYNWKVEEGTK